MIKNTFKLGKKSQLKLLSCILLLLLILPILYFVKADFPEGDYENVIQGNIISTDNNYGKITSTYSSVGWAGKHVYFINITNKLPSQGFDFALSLKDDDKIDYQSGKAYYLINVTYNETTDIYNKTTNSTTEVTEEKTRTEWKEFTQLFTKITRNDEDFYVIQNISFNLNQKRQVKIVLNVDPQSFGKFDLWIKRSVDSLNDAIANNLYIHIDPTWDNGGVFNVFPNNGTTSTDTKFNFTFNVSETNVLIDNCSLLMNVAGLGFNANVTLIENLIHNDSRSDSGCVGNYWMNNLSDVSGEGRDGQNNGAELTTDGLVGSAYVFQRENTEYINLSTDVTILAEDFSVSAWFKTETAHAGGIVGNREQGAPNNGVMIYTNIGNINFLVDTNIGTKEITLTVTYNDSRWHHVVATYDGSDMTLYFDYWDGAATTTTSQTNTAGSNDDIFIGARGTSYILGGEGFNGTIDEVLIFNRTLSSSEVSALYNNTKSFLDEGVNLSFAKEFNTSLQTVEWKVQCYANDSVSKNSTTYTMDLGGANTAPIVNNQFPLNSSYFYGQYINFTYNVTDPDGDDINNCTLWLQHNGGNWELNKTQGEKTNQSDGFDISTLSAWQRGLTTNGSDFWYTDIQDDWVYHLNASGDNQSDGFDIGASGCGSPTDITTNGSDFWIGDNNNNWIYHYSADGTNITDGFAINSPVGITTNGTDLWIMSSSDDKIYRTTLLGGIMGSFSYESETGGTTHNGLVTNGSDFWISEYSLKWVYHLDASGNNLSDGFDISQLGSSPVGITTPSFIDGGEPTEFYILDWTNYFIYHIKDGIEEGVNQTFSITLNKGENITWKVGCYDDEHLQGNSTAYNFTAYFTDPTAPVVNLQSPLSNTNYSTHYINFTYNVTAASTVDSCILWLQKSGSWELNYTDDSITETINQSINLTVEDVNLLWLVECNDTLNNKANSSSRNITIDTTAPTITLDSPLNLTTVQSTSADLKYTPSDMNLKNCTLTVFSTAISHTRNEYQPTNGTQITEAFTSTFAYGIWRWSVLCDDYFGNSYSTPEYTFTTEEGGGADDDPSPDPPPGGGSSPTFGGAVGAVNVTDLYCGDKICSEERGETLSSCPRDCSSILNPSLLEDKRGAGLIALIMGILIVAWMIFSDKKVQAALKKFTKRNSRREKQRRRVKR